MKNKRNIIILVITLVVVIVGAVIAVMAVGSKGVSNPAEQLTLAQRYLDEQDYEQAVIEFERLLEIDPKNADAYIGLARAYKALGEDEKAAEVLERALAEVDESDSERIEQAISELSEPAVETVDVVTTADPEETQAVAEETEEHAAPAEITDRVQLVGYTRTDSRGYLYEKLYIADNGNYALERYDGDDEIIFYEEYVRNDDGTRGRVVLRQRDERYTREYKQLCANVYKWLVVSDHSGSSNEEYEYYWNDDGVLESHVNTRTHTANDRTKVTTETFKYSFTLNDAGLVSSQKITRSTVYETFDANGTLLDQHTEKERLYDRIFYTYNEEGLLTEETHSKGNQITTYSYNEHGDIIEEHYVSEGQDMEGNITKNESLIEYTYIYHDNGLVAEMKVVMTESYDGYYECKTEEITRHNENGIRVYSYYCLNSSEDIFEYDASTEVSEFIGTYVDEEISEVCYDEWGNYISSYDYWKYNDIDQQEEYENSNKVENRYTFGDDGLPVSFETWSLEYTEKENGVITDSGNETHLASITDCEYQLIGR